MVVQVIQYKQFPGDHDRMAAVVADDVAEATLKLQSEHVGLCDIEIIEEDVDLVE